MQSVLINIDVSDLKAAARFYVDAFGLKVGRRFGGDGLELIGFPAPIYLLQKNEGSLPFANSGTPRSFQRHWTPVHLDIVVNSIGDAVKKAQAAGAKLESGPNDAPYGKIALFADPFGHGFCLIQFTGRGYDEIADS
jgi:predicted enzyme related to lactoylglutathione lyase